MLNKLFLLAGRFENRVRSAFGEPRALYRAEIPVFDRLMGDARNVVEFGMGQSTLRLLRETNATVWSVESSTDWINRMQEIDDIRFHDGGRLHIMPVDIGPIANWGHPADDSKRDCYPDYSTVAFREINPASIDRVFVDGRFRLACAFQAIAHCGANPGFRLLFHDFFNRNRYLELLDFVEVEEQVSSLGVFRVKPGLDPARVEEAWQRHAFDST